MLVAQCIMQERHLAFCLLCPNFTITLFTHVNQFHDLGICQLYYVGPSSKVGKFIYYSYI